MHTHSHCSLTTGMLDSHDWQAIAYREHPFSEKKSHCVTSLFHPSLFSAVAWSQNHSRYININDAVNATLCCRCVLVLTYTGIVGISGRSADGMSSKLSSPLLNSSIIRSRICRTQCMLICISDCFLLYSSHTLFFPFPLPQFLISHFITHSSVDPPWTR